MSWRFFELSEGPNLFRVLDLMSGLSIRRCAIHYHVSTRPDFSWKVNDSCHPLVLRALILTYVVYYGFHKSTVHGCALEKFVWGVSYLPLVPRISADSPFWSPLAWSRDTKTLSSLHLAFVRGKGCVKPKKHRRCEKITRESSVQNPFVFKTDRTSSDIEAVGYRTDRVMWFTSLFYVTYLLKLFRRTNLWSYYSSFP